MRFGACDLSALYECQHNKLRRGYLRLIQMVLQTKPDGLVHAGPPCSTWVWVNRGTSQRSSEYPEGDSTVPSVKSSNQNLVHICILCSFRPISWLWWLVAWMTMNWICVMLLCCLDLPRITCRLALVLLLAVCRACHCLVEQPRSSLMPYFEPFVLLAKLLAKHFGLAWRSTSMCGTQLLTDHGILFCNSS